MSITITYIHLLIFININVWYVDMYIYASAGVGGV